MKVVLGAMFRDSHDYIDRTLAQYQALDKELANRGDQLALVLVENDSEDDTRERLTDFARDSNTNLLVLHDDCPFYPSPYVGIERWRHITWLCNSMLEAVDESVDKFIYVDSDHAWEAPSMVRLLDHDVDCVSPRVMRANGTYYDVWGSRGMDGTTWRAHAPYHADFKNWIESEDRPALIPMLSVAGCTVVTGEVARTTRFKVESGYRGWNESMAEHGYQLWMDPAVKTVHP